MPKFFRQLTAEGQFTCGFFWTKWFPVSTTLDIKAHKGVTHLYPFKNTLFRLRKINKTSQHNSFQNFKVYISSQFQQKTYTSVRSRVWTWITTFGLAISAFASWARTSRHFDHILTQGLIKNKYSWFYIGSTILCKTWGSMIFTM